MVRDASAGIPEFITDNVMPHVRVLNAGESDVSHPTQGLLDMLTIRKHKNTLNGLTVTIIGDIAHSRVARSITEGLSIMGHNEIRLVSPAGLAPDMTHYPDATFHEDIDAAVSDADVVMALRIQKERIKEKSSLMTSNEYLQAYGLTEERVGLAKPDAIVMHPGPMNRDVEIAGARRRWSAVGHYRAGAKRTGGAHGCAGSDYGIAPVMGAAAKAHRGTIFVEDARVISQQAFPGNQFVLRVAAPECALKLRWRVVSRIYAAIWIYRCAGRCRSCVPAPQRAKLNFSTKSSARAHGCSAMCAKAIPSAYSGP